MGHSMGNYTELAINLELSTAERTVLDAIRLAIKGNPTYIAGGCLRDAVIGVPRKDVDIFICEVSDREASEYPYHINNALWYACRIWV
jgi:tRNA nucleotidyltransferase/poly(A) polymerase